MDRALPRLLTLPSAIPFLGVLLAGLVGATIIASALVSHGGADTDAYWDAAMRLRDGGLLYPSFNPEAAEVYRYAPWFAWAWVPVTYLPQQAVYTAWAGLLIVSTMVVVLPLSRRGPAGIALGILVGAGLIHAAIYGNVAPLIVLALTASSLHPIAIGIVGSLKLYPLFLTAGYVAERRWRDLLIAWGVALVLWAPALLYDLSRYTTTPGGGGISLWGTPMFWPLAITAAASTGYLAWRRSPWTWAAAAAMTCLAVPRVWFSNLGYFAPVTSARPAGPDASRP